MSLLVISMYAIIYIYFNLFKQISFLASTPYKQVLSIQRDRKHCINFVGNKNYLVGTVPYFQTL